MINKAIFSAVAVVLASAVSSGHAAELLLNGRFETPLVAAGTTGNPNPGLGILPTSWTILDGNATVDSTKSNLTHGVVTNGTGNTGSNNLPLDPFDAGSAQSLDISGNGFVVQTFTAQFTAPVTVKIDFGGRDTGSNTGAGSYWSLINVASGTTVATSSATPVKPAFGGWSTSTITTTANLVANTSYRFVISLDNPDQVDGASITQVPEPGTLAASGLGLGLLGWLGARRRRRG